MVLATRSKRGRFPMIRHFILVCVLGLGFSAQAEVNPVHARNAYAGAYRVTFMRAATGKPAFIDFTVDANLVVKIARSQSEVSGTARMAYSNSEIGPNSLPILNVLLSYGSDEDTGELQLRIGMQYGQSPVSQGKPRSQIVFLDLIETFNDGPNNMASVNRLKAKLERVGVVNGAQKLIPLSQI